MISKSIGLLSVSVVMFASALVVLGGLASLSYAASGGPTVVLSSTTASSTSDTSIPVIATFSESVQGLTSTNVTATNATVGSVSGSGTTFTFTLTPTASGTVTVMIAENMASSTGGTGNQASNMLTFMYGSSNTSTSTNNTGTSTTSTSTSGTAYLALSTYSGAPGTTFNAIGTNFDASESVSISFGSATSTATADSNGNFTFAMTTPSLPVGSATITATGQTSGRVATNSFYVQEATSTNNNNNTGSSTPLALTGIDTIKGNATADGTFGNGWEWVLHITVPENETRFAMKFGDFTSNGVSSTIPAMNNIRIHIPQSSNASSTNSAVVSSNNNYGTQMILVDDASTTTPGRQIKVHVQVAVPQGTVAGSYSTTFGALSTTTPF